MKQFRIVTILVFSLKILQTHSEIFSAVQHLKQLYKNEELVISGLEDFIYKLTKSIEDLERRKNYLQQLHTEIDSVEDFISNPLNAFLLIKRATFDIKLIEKNILSDLTSFREKVGHFASDIDLTGSVEGILRLQNTYKLKSSDIAKGIVNGRKIKVELTNEDLNLIATKAHEIGEEKFAQDYWRLLLLKNENIETKDEVLLSLAVSYKNSGKYDESLKIAEELLEKDPSKISVFMLKSELESLMSSQKHVSDKTNDEQVELDGKYHSGKEDILYQKSCRGEMKKTEKELSLLKCRYHSTNFFTFLARFKIEEMNLNPKITLFLDVLSDQEIDYLKMISTSKISRAMTFDKEVLITNERIAQISWHKGADKNVEKINLRVEGMTDLTIATAEDLQVQNYGIGGHYKLHYDNRLESQTPFNLGTGNRIATVLFYLSDVESGGSTVFPYLRLNIPPKKGSAVFWFNLKPSGTSDYLTRHAGCPVLIGSKYVANKWIHELGQNLKCTAENFPETLLKADEVLKEFF